MSKVSDIKISVIIVNYNVKEYLAQALSSIKRALENVVSEIIVIDNASIDGSVTYIRKNFPEVNLIENKKNVGFAKANNQGLKIASGEFIVLINPDTIVQEDTFKTLLSFFDAEAEAGAATCKIINPDGTFAIDCRHSIPTPLIAFWKVTGLSRLFPGSRIFGQYNLTYLDTEQSYPVPAVSGSFIMIRKNILDKIGYFDEQFFMYCEDIDLCHRINQAGFKIFYVHKTQIIHYKGESTKKDKLDYVITFNHSLYKFFQKYYAPSSVFLFRWLITTGIFFRGAVIYLKNFLKLYFPLLLDLLILNSALLISFIIRMEIKGNFLFRDFLENLSIVNIFASVLFLFISFYLDIYPAHRFSMQSIFKANIFSFVLLAFLTFFLKQFAFSRIVVLISFIISPILMLSWRWILKKYYKGDKSLFGKDLFSKRTVVVGEGSSLIEVNEKLARRKEIDYEIFGWISVNNGLEDSAAAHPKFLGTIDNLPQLIKINNIRQIIFSAHSLSYKQILFIMSSIKNPLVEFKMIPSNLDVIIGKSHIERLEDYPLLDIEYSIRKKFNTISKRIFDLFLASSILLIFFPVSIVAVLRKHRYPVGESGFLNFLVKIWNVLLGKFSFVGYPISAASENPAFDEMRYKPGLTGLIQLNKQNIGSPEDAEKFHLYYMKNQSFFVDVEILLKSAMRFFKNFVNQAKSTI